MEKMTKTFFELDPTLEFFEKHWKKTKTDFKSHNNIGP